MVKMRGFVRAPMPREQHKSVIATLAAGASVSPGARNHRVSRQTIMQVRSAAIV